MTIAIPPYTVAHDGGTVYGGTQRIPPDTVAHDQKKSPDRPGHDRYGGHRNDIVTRPAGAIDRKSVV